MRILSQDGRIDMPYEQMIINIDYTNKNQIVACGVSCDGENSIFHIAKYSTAEKAQKAMEMLREAYMAHNQYDSMTAEQRALFIMSVSEKEQCNLYGMFRFPTDEELEVDYEDN